MDSFEMPQSSFNRDKIDELQERVKELENIVGTFISWTAQSAAAPLSVENASDLLSRLHKQNK
jgi:hypothetical protein